MSLVSKQDLIDNLSCAIRPDHIFHNPKALLCGHSVCDNCIPKNIAQRMIKCKICGIEELNDHLNKSKHTKVAQLCLEQNIDQLFDLIKNRFEDKLKATREIINETSKNIASNIEFVKEEIDIRIESLKSQLDQIGTQMKSQLNDEKLKLETMLKLNEIDSFEDYFKGLCDNIEKSKMKNQEYFYESQYKIKELNEIIQNIRLTSTPYITLDALDETIFTGNCININNIRLANNPRENIISARFDAITLDNNLSSISSLDCVDRLLVTSYHGQIIYVYDKSFNLIKTINSITNQKVNPIGIACNDRKEIFICDYTEKKILKTNIDFTLLTHYGTGDESLIGPSDVCCYNNMVYVCDFDNKRIEMFDNNLLHQKRFKFDYSPWYIAILRDTACVRSGFQSPKVLYFYDIKSFNVKYKYENHYGFIGAIGSCFYEYCDQSFFCYDYNGQLIEEIETDFTKLPEGRNGKIVYFNGKLIIPLDKNLLKI